MRFVSRLWTSPSSCPSSSLAFSLSFGSAWGARAGATPFHWHLAATTDDHLKVRNFSTEVLEEMDSRCGIDGWVDWTSLGQSPSPYWDPPLIIPRLLILFVWRPRLLCILLGLHKLLLCIQFLWIFWNPKHCFCFNEKSPELSEEQNSHSSGTKIKTCMNAAISGYTTKILLSGKSLPRTSNLIKIVYKQ